MSISFAASALHDGIAAIAGALQLPAEADTADGLSITIGDMPVCIEPTTHGRIAAFFELGEVARVSVSVMLSLLAEAAAWSSDGEAMRFAIVGDKLVLLWTPVPMAVTALVAQWREALATAVSAHTLAAQFAD